MPPFMRVVDKVTMVQNFNGWSRSLVWPSTSFLDRCIPIAEGCCTAFNATNFIRVCLHYGTQAPVFSRMSGFQDVAHLWLNDGETRGDPSTIAKFGSVPLEKQKNLKKIVLENYVEGAKNIVGYQWPQEGCMLVVGHENEGVAGDSLRQADDVVYIPHQGTISSLNVVTALGIALHCLHSNQPEKDPLALASCADPEMACARPDRKGDLRAVRPSLYHTSKEHITEHSRHHRIPRLSLLYENEYDQRNLGGIMRNANAFGVKCVYYTGRRKMNRQGAVGSYLFVDHIYLRDTDETQAVLESHEVWVLRPSYLWRHDLEHFSVCFPKEDVNLDDTESVKRAVQDTLFGGAKDILLVMHQESMPVSPRIQQYAQRAVNVVGVGRRCSAERGLPPCTASGIALLKLFHVMRSL